jgi:hypothetical protein
MIDPSVFCEADETIIGLENNDLGCTTYMVGKPGRADNDRVFLDVQNKTEACILTDGNPFTIETMHGFGRLALVDIETGEQKDIFLEPGVNVDIPVGVVYDYTNCGEEGSQLIIRDTGTDFRLEDEATVAAMTAALSNTFIPASS